MTKIMQFLASKVDHIIQSKKKLKSKQSEHEVDIAVVCALPEEQQAILRLVPDWEEKTFTNSNHVYYYRAINGIGIASTLSHRMGLIASTMLSMEIIQEFSPKLLVITGFCAGVKEKTNIGDVIVPDMTWEYAAGKISKKKDKPHFEPAPYYINTKPDIQEYFKRLAIDEKFLAQIKSEWPGNKPSDSLRIHVGPMTSGNKVVSAEEEMDKVKEQNRKAVGLDMETYGVYYAANHCQEPKPIPLSIKSVCDYGDRSKTDDYHNYSAFVSAKIFEKVILDERSNFQNMFLQE